MAEIEVFDMEGNKKDFAWAKAKYGVAFRRASGQKVYRLIELREKTGNHSLVTKVLDKDGNPILNADVAFYWPDAPSPPDPPTEVYPHDWYSNFIHGPTNVNGDVGPGMGTGAYHGEGEGGPHAVWVRDPNIPSDICEKLGMLAGTFHDHLDQKFKLMEGEESMSKFVEVNRTVKVLPPEGVNQNHISIKCSGEPNFYDTRADLMVGNDPTNPDWQAPDPIWPVGLHHYNIGAMYNPVEGETSRTFWVIIRTAQEKAISDPIPFVFNTGEGRRYTVQVKWQEPGTTPPPPTSDVVPLLKEIRDILKASNILKL